MISIILGALLSVVPPQNIKCGEALEQIATENLRWLARTRWEIIGKRYYVDGEDYFKILEAFTALRKAATTSKDPLMQESLDRIAIEQFGWPLPKFNIIIK